MENASKALIMAGSVLIGIIILSTFVYIFRSSANFAQSYETTVGAKNIVNFNNRFEKFLDRTDVTMYEILSLINFAKDYNQKDNRDTVNGIDVMINNSTYMKKSENDIIKEIKNDPQKKYICVGVEYDKDTQIVNLIQFRTGGN